MSIDLFRLEIIKIYQAYHLSSNSLDIDRHRTQNTKNKRARANFTFCSGFNHVVSAVPS